MIEFENAIIGNVVKNSKNIVDLIEIGDIVNYTFWHDDDFTIFTEGIRDLTQLQQFRDDLKEEYITLNKILTKEQYEQNSYKI